MKKQKTCPNCGYCPNCGRSAQPVYPSYPVYPWYPTGPIWISPQWGWQSQTGGTVYPGTSTGITTGTITYTN